MITPLKEQIKCLKKEISRRKHVYPKLVENNRMDSDELVFEIQAMQDALETLTQLQGIIK